jgi:hypothetical protein
MTLKRRELQVEFIKKNIYLEPNEAGRYKMHVTPIGDVHEGSPCSDMQVVHEFMESRKDLENHWFIGNGDMVEAIFPGDPRFTGSQDLPGDDAVIDKIIDYLENRYGKYRWLGMAQGNHENKAMRIHYGDIIGRLCGRIKIPYLRYSAQIFLSCRSAVTRKVLFPLRILIHHGAWTGHASKGVPGALRWAQTYPGWELLIFSHSHKMCSEPVDFKELTTNGAVIEYDGRLVNTGSFLKTEVTGHTSYSERRGYPRSYVGAPLVTITKKGGVCRPNVRVEV